MNNNKSSEAYKTIGEVAKELDLINRNTGQLQTHTIRYWETQFKQIKPIIGVGKRRYYSSKVFLTIKKIKFLLKERGLTINGVKKILNNVNTHPLDEGINLGINTSDFKNADIIKNKIKNISKIIKDLKKLK